MKSFLKNENGAAAVFVALGMILLLGRAALAVDLGGSYRAKTKLQDAVDNAAYAAGSLLPSNKNAAVKSRITGAVEDSLRANGIDPQEIELDYVWDSSDSVYYAIRVNARQQVNYGFAKALGESAGFVSATAKASAQPIDSTFSAIGIYIDNLS